MNAGKSGVSNARDNAGGAVSAAEFAAALDRLGPFEAAPQLAVAVSGGPDSMALALLAADWAKAKGGGITALTVDHRLRAASADEARQTGVWLKARGIDHQILVRQGAPLSASIQAKARQARYGLLTGWCRDHGILHLLLAHHLDDQAETLLLRLGRGSGLDGLAAMPALTEDGVCRLLRPLLSFPRQRLKATLDHFGQEGIQDPSNTNPAFARVRIRRALASTLEPLGLTAGRLAETAGRLGDARAALERPLERVLARAVSLHPAGFAWLDPATLEAEPAETRLRALAAAITTIGGEAYPPRFDRLQHLAGKIWGPFALPASTLGGCRILAIDGKLLICREIAAVAPPQAIIKGHFLWDRFAGRADGYVPDGLAMGALGTVLEPILRKESRHRCLREGIPWRAAPALPALRLQDRVVFVPHLSWAETGFQTSLTLRFQPRRRLTGAGFRGS